MKKTFASYGYLNPDFSGSISIGASLLFVSIPLVILVGTLVIIEDPSFPQFIPTIFVALISFNFYSKAKNGSRKIILGRKYLMEGESIVYYSNLSELKVNYRTGVMALKTPTKNLIIKKEYFSAESSKPHKIRISRTKKFNKIAQRVHDKIKEVNPSVKITVTER